MVLLVSWPFSRQKASWGPTNSHLSSWRFLVPSRQQLTYVPPVSWSSSESSPLQSPHPLALPSTQEASAGLPAREEPHETCGFSGESKMVNQHLVKDSKPPKAIQTIESSVILFAIVATGTTFSKSNLHRLDHIFSGQKNECDDLVKIKQTWKIQTSMSK